MVKTPRRPMSQRGRDERALGEHPRSRAMCSSRICSNGASKINSCVPGTDADAHARDRNLAAQRAAAAACASVVRRARRRVLLGRVMRLDDVRSKPGACAHERVRAAPRPARRCCTPSEKFGAASSAPPDARCTSRSTCASSRVPAGGSRRPRDTPARASARMFAGAAAGTVNSTATSAPLSSPRVMPRRCRPRRVVRRPPIRAPARAASMARPIFPMPTIAMSPGSCGRALAEECGVQPLHRGLHLLVVDDHREIDAGGAERQHVHAARRRAPRARAPSPAPPSAIAPPTTATIAAISLDRHVAELRADRTTIASSRDGIVDRERDRHLRRRDDVHRRAVALEDLEDRAQKARARSSMRGEPTLARASCSLLPAIARHGALRRLERDLRARPLGTPRVEHVHRNAEPHRGRDRVRMQHLRAERRRARPPRRKRSARSAAHPARRAGPP